MQESTWSRNWQAAHEKKERAKMERTEMDWHKYAVSLEVQLTNAAMQNGQLEQQLAQAREELRIALAQRQDYRAEATQARALLEKFAVDETERIGLYWDESVGMAVCVYCESGGGHLPDCPIVKARAFLGKEA